MKRTFVMLLCIILTCSVPLSGFGETRILYEGSDLEAGTYSITCKEVDIALCTIATFDSRADYAQYAGSESVTKGLQEYADYYKYMKKGEECTIRIDKSHVLLIDGGTATLTLKEKYVEPTAEEKATWEAAAAVRDAIVNDPHRSSGEKLMAELNYLAAVKSDMETAVESMIVSFMASGYTKEQALNMVARAQAGEEIHDFARVNYDEYNTPAEENGFAGKKIMAEGIVKKYIADGNKKNCTYGMIIEQEDGNQWLIYCAEKVKGKILGKLWDSDPAKHVFEGYENQEVNIYGKYLGFSEKYKLPVIDIFTYGGMLVMNDNTWIQTYRSERNMFSDNNNFGWAILEASKTVTSEPWR